MSKKTNWLPPTQPIAGNPYSLEEVKEVIGGCAACDRSEKRLIVELDSPTEYERTVRWAHECIHGGEVEYGMGPFLDDANNSDVDRLAHLFAEMLWNVVFWQEDEE